MDYKKVYESLIEKRKVRHPLNKDEKGCENHHIVPRYLGGSDENDNMIRLTVKEHIFAHQLLARIHSDPKMWYTAHLMMCVQQKRIGENKCLRLAAIAREKMAQFRSEAMKGSVPWNKGKHYEVPIRQGRKLSEEHRRKLSESHKGQVPANKGKSPSIETRRKMSLSLKGRPSAMKGKKHSEETKRRMSEIHRNISDETRKRMSNASKGRTPWNKGKIMTESFRATKWKAVVQCDKDGNFVNEFESVCDAALKTNILKSSISNCLCGRSKTAGGFMWNYKEASK